MLRELVLHKHPVISTEWQDTDSGIVKSGAILLLNEKSTESTICIPIDLRIGNAIAAHCGNVEAIRPQTFDLFKNILVELGAVVKKVVITKVENEIIFADLHLEDKDGVLHVLDSQPHDDIALAIRFGAP